MATSKAVQKFDLGSEEFDTKAACEAGAEVQLRSPVSGEPMPIYWSVVGTESGLYRKYMANRIREESKKEINQKKRGKDPEPTELEELERNSINLIVSCSTGWHTELEDGTSVDSISFKGDDLSFTKENAKTILRERPWILKQLDSAIGDIQTFMPSK